MTTNQQCYFDDIEHHISRFLLSAKDKVAVAQCYLSNSKLIALLGSLAERGVKVAVLIDRNRSSVESLANNRSILSQGVVLYVSKEAGLMHHKFCVIDEEVLVTGSYNWSINAKTNSENIIVTRNRETALQYQQEFSSLCSKAELLVAKKLQRMHPWERTENEKFVIIALPDI